MMPVMADNVFLITGASSGIGAETARQAPQAGYRLVLGARSVDKLTALGDECGGGAGQLRTLFQFLQRSRSAA